MDANGRSVAQEVVEHEQGLDSRFATGGFYGQAIYLAERATYPIGGRYVRSAGLAAKVRAQKAARAATRFTPDSSASESSPTDPVSRHAAVLRAIVARAAATESRV
jgi:hypothetical protein